MEKTLEMIEKYVEYELKVADLYIFYNAVFPEDSNFWWNMSMEEKNHASLLRSSIVFVKVGKFPDELAYDCLHSVEPMLEEMDCKMRSFRAQAPSKCEAYRFALKVETSHCERKFMESMLTESQDKVMKILQNICNMDQKHFERIGELIDKIHCPPEEEEVF